MEQAGITPPNTIEPDGALHRFASNGKPGDSAGWYVLYDDGVPAGAFGDWRTGHDQTWRAESSRALSPAEQADSRLRMDAIRRQTDADRMRQHEAAGAEVAAIWQGATPAAADHPYLIRKGVKPHCLRVDD